MKDLNPAQQEAVTSPDGPVLVIAGAGTGKTRTLACRVAYLIEKGVPADRILLLTFTRRAAAEMLTRDARIAGNEAKRVWGGTFHATARGSSERPKWVYPGSRPAMSMTVAGKSTSSTSASRMPGLTSTEEGGFTRKATRVITSSKVFWLTLTAPKSPA